MKKILLSLLLLSSSLSYAVPIKLPDAQTIEQRFSEKGLANCEAKSNILEQLAERELDSAEVSRILAKQQNASLDETQLIYEIIFADYPEALDEIFQQIAQALVRCL